MTRSLQQALLTLRDTVPQTSGRCRTRWSGATLALPLHAQHGVTVSAETVRRWLPALDGGWKRATLLATDNHPCRTERLARRRWGWEHRQPWDALVCADALDLPRLPKVGGLWMPTGTPVTGRTPGQHATHSLAGALAVTPGQRWHGRGARTTHALCRALLARLAERSPPSQYRRLSVVVEHGTGHTATAVEQWRASHLRVPWRFLPPSGPRANPIERAGGDVHDTCPRHHTRTRLEELGGDVEQHGQNNGPWCSHLSPLSYAPAVTTAMQALAAEALCQAAAYVYESRVD